MDKTWAVVGLIGTALFLGWLVGKSQSPQAPAAAYRLQRLEPESSNTPLLSNEETWEWTDWKGRERKLTVHRTVH